MGPALGTFPSHRGSWECSCICTQFSIEVWSFFMLNFRCLNPCVISVSWLVWTNPSCCLRQEERPQECRGQAYQAARAPGRNELSAWEVPGRTCCTIQ